MTNTCALTVIVLQATATAGLNIGWSQPVSWYTCLRLKTVATLIILRAAGTVIHLGTNYVRSISLTGRASTKESMETKHTIRNFRFVKSQVSPGISLSQHYDLEMKETLELPRKWRSIDCTWAIVTRLCAKSFVGCSNRTLEPGHYPFREYT